VYPFAERELRIIKVMIAADDAQKIEELKLLLEQSEMPLEVIGTSDTRRCLEVARAIKPDAVLVSDVDASMPAVEITRQLYYSQPGTAVIILASSKDHQDPEYIRRAMRSKASDVLSEEPLLDALTRSIMDSVKLEEGRRATRAERAPWRARELGKLIAFYSPKGGVGKSFLAANLGTFMSTRNPQLKIALVDLDLRFGDQYMMLNLEKSRSVLDLLSVVRELSSEAVDNAVITHPSGLRVLLPPPEPQQADLVDEQSVREILLAFKRYHDFVIVDLPSTLSDVTLTTLEVADHILQICTPDVLTIWKTRVCLELWEGLGIPRELVSLVLNRVSKKSEVKTEDIRNLFSAQIMAEIPADFFTIQPYINTGVTLVEVMKGGPILDSIEGIANQLLSTVER